MVQRADGSHTSWGDMVHEEREDSTGGAVRSHQAGKPRRGEEIRCLAGGLGGLLGLAVSSS